MAQYRKRPELVDAIQLDGGNWLVTEPDGVVNEMSPDDFVAEYEPIGPTVTDGPAPSTL